MPQTITPGSQSTTYQITNPDSYTLDEGATRTQTGTTAVQATVTSGLTTIAVDGTLRNDTSGQRALRAALANGQISVGANGEIRALDADAIQAQAFSGANAGITSAFNLTNLGRILSDTSITAITPSGAAPPGAAYALNFNATVGAPNAGSGDVTSGGTITNGSTANTAALIQSNSGDAIRLGAHQTLLNYGIIRGAGPVNDSSSNNSFSNTSTATRYDISRGVRINAASATNDTIDNRGLIEGSQHGIDVGNVNATNIQVFNRAGATILGRNGSGVGADTVGASAGTVVVNNGGTILGEYAPNFDRAGLRTIDGDGDGVDVDGGATVTNDAGGTIAGAGAGGVLNGQGAGGFDSNGRANRSEGLSLGGGTVTNDGTISGADSAIVVNNDSNGDGSRSGVLATAITNGATGQIIGQNGYAIRLENKAGDARIDNDTIVNAGSIVGNGTIPTGTVLLQNGTADAGTVGTLDGVTYTAADAGSARFLRGDGSAIQTGEGSDSLSNYGTITGNTGRALNLEGGDDTLNLYTGATVTGRIDGGAGSDRINLRLDDRTGRDVHLGSNSGATTGSLANVVNVETLSVESGAWTIQDGQSYGSGITIGNGAALTVGAAGSLSGAVANTGTLTFAASGDLIAANAISGTGSVEQAGSGTLTLTGDNTYSGGTVIRSGTLAVTDADSAGSGIINFIGRPGGGSARLELGINAQVNNATFGNLLVNLGPGAEIGLAGLSGASADYDEGAGLLTVTGTRTGNSTQVVQNFRLISANLTTVGVQDDGNGGTVILLCFTTGTRIRTDRGEIAVEDLRVGDRAVTVSGALRPITWIGRREIVAEAGSLPFHQQPVRIRAGAFGRGLPARDLSLSPGHPVLVGAEADGEGGVLVPVMCLINGTTITREPRAGVTYWHVELDAHDILLAEGLPAESYIDGGDRAFFIEASDHALHDPDFVPAGWGGRCRPVAVEGAIVEAERMRLGAVFAEELAGHGAWTGTADGLWLSA
ncbi:Hint domain-containing protein [Methylorubrum podarium]|uniref:Hint domain-containing protein n=1 Tax=Methylorubrum podarium TaxID=200476 RepID=UPI001EE38D8C|nr:Hint domain-containing protein [Methylorubrum podarium]GJE70061.1 hypothetical protein CHKEEEPN_1595 [Methylorubrum podarium]